MINKKRKEKYFLFFKKNKQLILNPHIAALSPSLIQTYRTRWLLLFEKNTPLYFFTLSFSLSLYLLPSEGDTSIHTHVMVDGVFFLRVSARETREELVYSSPICMTYNNEKKKRYFTYIDDKKKEERNKLCTSASVFNDEYVYI